MAHRSPEALLGQTLGGRFRVLYTIASGGMGTVYEARDEVLSRRVAIKVIRGDHLVDPALRARFKREALATAAVSHPSLVALHDLSLDSDPPFFVMELVDGAPLEELLSREQRIPWQRAAKIAIDAFEGLDALHAAGVVHRDIKPSNLMIVGSGPTERCRLIDLGVARLITAPIDDARTATGVAVGTPAFMAPEQLAGERVGPAADLWAMGVVLYKCIVGFHPFSTQRAQAAPLRVHEIVRDVPAELGELVASLLAHAPEDRPRSAGHVARQLRSLRQRAGVSEAASPEAARVDGEQSSPGASQNNAPIGRPAAALDGGLSSTIVAPPLRRSATPIVIGIAIGAVITVAGGLAVQSMARSTAQSPESFSSNSVIAVDDRVPLAPRASAETQDTGIASVADPVVSHRVASPTVGLGRDRARLPAVPERPIEAQPVETATNPAVVAASRAPQPRSTPVEAASPWSGAPAVVLPSSPGNRPGNRLSVQYSSAAGRAIRDAVAPDATPRLERCVDPRTHYAQRLFGSYRVRITEEGAVEEIHVVAHDGTDVERQCIERALRAVRWPVTASRYDTYVRATVQL